MDWEVVNFSGPEVSGFVQLLFKKANFASNAFGSLFYNKKCIQFCGAMGIIDQ